MTYRGNLGAVPEAADGKSRGTRSQRQPRHVALTREVDNRLAACLFRRVAIRFVPGNKQSWLGLQGLGAMFRSSFELMITGALAVRKQGQSRGVWRLLSVEGQEEVSKEVDRHVRSRLNGQDRMERCRDAGWRYSSQEGDLRLWGYRAVPVRPLVGRGVLAKTTPVLRGWEEKGWMSTAEWRAFPISRETAQNIREGDCCRSGRGGWDGMAQGLAWMYLTSTASRPWPRKEHMYF